MHAPGSRVSPSSGRHACMLLLLLRLLLLLLPWLLRAWRARPVCWMPPCKMHEPACMNRLQQLLLLLLLLACVRRGCLLPFIITAVVCFSGGFSVPVNVIADRAESVDFHNCHTFYTFHTSHTRILLTCHNFPVSLLVDYTLGARDASGMQGARDALAVTW